MTCCKCKFKIKANHDNCILTPQQLYEWGAKNTKEIFFFYVSSETVHEHSLKYDLIVLLRLWNKITPQLYSNYLFWH